MDILPIQGSAVPCERVFSSAKETMTARQNHIAPDLMEALQMLKFGFKRGRRLDFTAGTSREDQIETLEGLVNEKGSVPEDPVAFIGSLLVSDDSDDEVDDFELEME